MKKSLISMTFIALLLVTLITIGLNSRSAVKAESDNNLLSESLWSSATATTAAHGSAGVSLPRVKIYFLTSDNMIYLLNPGSSVFIQLGRVPKVANGNLIGMDFRVADGNKNQVYGVTDKGNLILINLRNVSSSPTVVSSLTPRFAGGFQSLMDFNPVVNALRLLGSNDQNFAVVNSNGGNLNTTAVQTAATYAVGDVNAGVDPNMTGGAYTNNVVGAANTIFYTIDYDLDTFCTISTRNATGSSNTGGGVFQTIGNVVNTSGSQINFNPTTDLDIYTDGNGKNFLVGINNETVFTIDLSQINPNLALGTTQNVVAKTVKIPAFLPADSFIDIAITPFISSSSTLGASR